MRKDDKRLKTGNAKYNWKGEEACYFVKHAWLHKHFGKAKECKNLDCIVTSPKRYEWALISTECTRDPNDYTELCASCHRKWDMGLCEIRLKDKTLLCKKEVHKNLFKKGNQFWKVREKLKKERLEGEIVMKGVKQK